jgi:hypothetical protein
MAVPTYTEDLTDFDLCENDGGTFGEMTEVLSVNLLEWLMVAHRMILMLTM